MASATRKNIARAIRQGLRGTKTTRRGSMVRVANEMALKFRDHDKTFLGYSTWKLEWLHDLDPTWVWEETGGRGFFGVNPKAFEAMLN